MTALVTGATGFLGGAFVARLLAHDGDRIRALARPGSPRTSAMGASACPNIADT